MACLLELASSSNVLQSGNDLKKVAALLTPRTSRSEQSENCAAMLTLNGSPHHAVVFAAKKEFHSSSYAYQIAPKTIA
jgi:hypothetical protein